MKLPPGPGEVPSTSCCQEKRGTRFQAPISVRILEAAGEAVAPGGRVGEAVRRLHFAEVPAGELRIAADRGARARCSAGRGRSGRRVNLSSRSGMCVTPPSNTTTICEAPSMFANVLVAVNCACQMSFWSQPRISWSRPNAPSWLQRASVAPAPGRQVVAASGVHAAQLRDAALERRQRGEQQLDVVELQRLRPGDRPPRPAARCRCAAAAC